MPNFGTQVDFVNDKLSYNYAASGSRYAQAGSSIEFATDQIISQGDTTMRRNALRAFLTNRGTITTVATPSGTK